MDSFTQIVLGVSVAHVALNKSVSTKKIFLLGAIVATLPDLDIYIAKIFNDPLTEIEIHRGFSHSIMFFLMLSMLLTFLIKRWFQETSLKQLYITIFLILLTHSLLDVFTTWGTQLFWPVSNKIALKSVFVVDLFYTLPLLIAVFWGLKKKKKAITYTGLGISTFYLIWGLSVQQMVKSRVEGQFYKQFPSKTVQTTIKPTFSNSFLWNVIIQDTNGFYISDYAIFDSKEMNFQYFQQNKKLINHLNDKNINRLKELSENQYIITQNKNGLVFNDLRFGLLKNTDNETQFAFSYQLIPTKNGYAVKELPKDKRDGMQLLKNIWNRIFNR
ncbi:metal-dependent hydrolase [Flavobacterium sp. CBA20B-1]|uniref:metal-dependent hydrolase n=1 Tax=unclassified Flavobacterium TaxID=196869 RepID=UPI0022256E2E|nr:MULTISPECIES: metal-dependent hydrolase [unclassified Flavobacterium]WCM42299.1 metal-dependent hydrolase [Flavobacterium sp. CBA20B-1]